MRERIRIASHAPHVRTLDHIHDGLVELFREIHAELPGTRLGYVAGIITSDGPKKLWDNIARLERYTDRVREAEGFPVFSATDVFSKELFDRLDVGAVSEKEYQPFWRNVLGCGYVTDIFLTPRWEESRGATDEWRTATKLGLTIHYVHGAAVAPAVEAAGVRR